jgi:hypothetical protein
MLQSAIYFLAGLIAGLAIAWYLTRQYFEVRDLKRQSADEKNAPLIAGQHGNSSSEEENEKGNK